MITVEKITVPDQDKVALCFLDDTTFGLTMFNMNQEEYDYLVGTICERGEVPEMDDDEPSDEELMLIEMEEGIRDDEIESLEASLSQERARVRQLLNIVEELVMR